MFSKLLTMKIELIVPPSDAAVYASSFLQFVEHFSFNSQLNFPAWISVKYCCAVLLCVLKMCFFHFQPISSAFLFCCSYKSKTPKCCTLCKKTQNCSNKHTHKHTCSRMLRMSLGNTIVPRKVVRRLTWWQRKWFPSGLNTEETLCCQSPMPAKLWRSLYSQYQHEHLLRHTITMHLRSTGACSGTETTNPGTKAYFAEKTQGKKPVKPYKWLWHVQTMLHYATSTLTERY